MSATVSSWTLLTHQAFLSERVPFTLMYLVFKFFHESTSAAPSGVMLNLEIPVVPHKAVAEVSKIGNL